MAFERAVMDLGFHGRSETIIRTLLANGIIDDSKVDANANIQQSKIQGLVAALAALTARAANETVTGAWAFAQGLIVPTPTQGTHATNKAYVDALVLNGRRDKPYVRVATTAALPTFTFNSNVMTAASVGAFPAIDGVSDLQVGDEILVKDETGANAKYNGPYVVTDLGGAGTTWILTRRADADSDAEVNPGDTYFVAEGTVSKGNLYSLITPEPLVVNTTSLTFSWTGAPGIVAKGEAIVLNGNEIGVKTDGVTIGAPGDELAVLPGGLDNTHFSADPADRLDWGKVNKTSSSLADFATRNAQDVNISGINGLAGTNVHAAMAEHQADIEAAEARITTLETAPKKTRYRVSVYTSTNNQAQLLKNPLDPPIPNDEALVDFHIGGRLMFMGADRQFTVKGDGSGIDFAPLTNGESLTLTYWADPV